MVKETYDLMKKINSNLRLAPSGEVIFERCLRLAENLIAKNISYGDSALNPNPIFSKGGQNESLASRIDDKLNRIANSQSYPGDNDLDDLLGYLVLYSIYREREIANGYEELSKERACRPTHLIV
jgi:hypothetical protein